MIIKCPECGHQVSERAPICPHCGVEISGKITRCSHCGEIYFTSDGVCPSCHQAPAAAPSASARTSQPPSARSESSALASASSSPSGSGRPSAASQTSSQLSSQPHPEGAAPKRSHAALIASFVFACVVLATLFYFYQRSQRDKEAEDYEFAMRSTDEEVLKSYLNRYGDTSSEHRDSVECRLLALQKGDEEWQNALLSNSRSALQRYIDQHPESVHCQEAADIIDSLDWIAAQKSNSEEALRTYLSQHANGRYIDEATVLIEKLRLTTVQPGEKDMITSLFRKFFQSVSARDETSLVSTMSMVIDNFLGKSNATGNDVVTFLNKFYKDDISKMIWHIDASSYKITKTEVAENEFKYEVTFNARQDVERGAEAEVHTYRINASVTNDGCISSFNLTKLN